MQRLRQWLLRHRVSIDERLALVKGDNGSAAVNALGDILPGTTLAKIPKSACLSHRTSSLTVPSDRLDDLPPAIRLAVHVAHELALGADSVWAEYLDACPSSPVPVALLWDPVEDQDALAWLRGTAVEREMRKLGYDKRWIERFYNERAGNLYATASVSQPGLPLFLHACSLVASRAFQIDTYHTLALVPFADTFNHSDSPHVHLASDHWVCSVCGALDECPHDGQQSDGACLPRISPAASTAPAADTCDLVSERFVPAGEEIFNTYGPLSNAQLLASYGFVLEANEHEYLLFDAAHVGEVASFRPPDLDLRLATINRWIRTEEEVDLGARFAEHPLITDARLPDALGIDADARLDFRFFLLAVWLAQDSTRDTDEPSELVRNSLAVAESLEQVVADAESFAVEDEVGREAGPSSPYAIARRVAELIPSRNHTGLALRYLAGERLLLEHVRLQWTFD
ncbi:hypothetical protein C6P46_001914 [Rhodotorula mucilaginosa]|uniref:SET domain-containing protein n=1 Tax=Rhodotorula mucilaginosa TaxID=5537 RepID=A0A9P6W6R7_RHOMI|nr:hypothetical protein C6P46_001914 [Rhodotorula mucilaginosa]TKA56446.1 hypothetical protein B0A53_02016 [Rhodotorula sp. CCFEE 5036]